MRIISGNAGGRRLIAPSGDKTRPTSDKIRGSLFNILMSRVADSVVLDLFGGTGAMALEAMSRGAARAVIVDTDRLAIEAIRKNTQAVMGDDFRAQVDIIRSDYKRALSAMDRIKFDLVFLDPPYMMTDAYAQAQRMLEQRDLLADDCVLVCERSRDAAVTYAEGFEIYDTRAYGDTVVELVRRVEKEQI